MTDKTHNLTELCHELLNSPESSDDEHVLLVELARGYLLKEKQLAIAVKFLNYVAPVGSAESTLDKIAALEQADE